MNPNQNPLKVQIMSLEDYNSWTGEEDLRANGMEDLFADGQPTQQKVIDTANPFIIVLTNTSAAAISNVTFLNAAQSIMDTTYYGVTAGVTPTVGYSNKTYQGLLAQFLLHEITFGAFQIETSTSAEATATILFRTDNQRGEAGEVTLVPKILPTWYQTGNVYIEKEIKISAWTQATLSSIAASATYKLTMYPYKRTAPYGTQIVYGKPQIKETAMALGR